MCLYSRKDKLKLSNRNITCYKVLDTRYNEMRSPYIGRKYVFGINVPDEEKVFFRRNRRSNGDIRGRIPKKYKYEVSEGLLHAYTSLTEAIRTKQLLEKWHNSSKESNAYRIYKCFVPKETEYVTGWINDIAAKALYVKDVVNEKSFIYKLLNWIAKDEDINF